MKKAFLILLSLVLIICSSLVISQMAKSNEVQYQKNDIKSKDKVKDYNKFLSSLSSDNPESIIIATDKYFQLFSLKDNLEERDRAFLLFQKKYEKIIETLQDNLGGSTIGLNAYVFDKIKEDEYKINEKRLTEKELYYKKYGIKLNYIYKAYLPDVDYNYLIKEFNSFISPSMNEYLVFCLKESNKQIIDEGEVLVNWDELRNRLLYLEAFIKNNPKFAGKEDVQIHLDNYANYYMGSSLYGDGNKIKTDAKQSFERFIKLNKNSKYYIQVLKQYNLLKKYNFDIQKYYNQ